MIYNYGSLNYDDVFRVPSIVRPGETIASVSLMTTFGGKGFNQSVAIARSGSSVTHAGSVGPDGQDLVDYLKESGVDVGLIDTTDVPTGRAIIQVDERGENAIVLFTGANRQIGTQVADALIERIAPGDLVVAQNEVNGVSDVLRRAAARGAQVVFNPAPMDGSIADVPLAKVSVLVLNQGEAAVLSGTQDVDAGIATLWERYRCPRIVVTLGGEGVCYSVDSGEAVTRPAYSVQPVDTTGAGDTFVGFLVGAVARGLRFDDAIDQAMRAAAVAITRPGAAQSIPTVGQVERYDF